MNPLIERMLQSANTAIPVILDEDSALEAVWLFSGIHVSSLDECISGNIPWVSLYEKNIEEDKKHLSVKDIRRWISDISAIPYEKKHIYILRDFDEATHQSMNATLKILEEPPAYAIIFLVVSNPEALLETIMSRTLQCFSRKNRSPLSQEIKIWIREYAENASIELSRYIYKERFDRDSALEILIELAYFADSRLLSQIEESITSLYNVNETPRNIIDRIILTPRK